MAYSMTGYARAEKSLPIGRLAWELRSVNHRYLEISLKVPEEFRPQQNVFRERVQTTLKRGKVDASLFLHLNPGEAKRMVVNSGVLLQLAQARRDVESEINERGAPSWLDILRWPNVISEEATDLGDIHEHVVALLDQALEELQAARAREGQQMQNAIRERRSGMAAGVASVRERLPVVQEGLRLKLHERLSTIKDQADIDIDSQRFEQEVTLLLHKMDVSEELDRLDAHLKELDQALAEGGPVGRRLDFLMQEFNREANTLASKSQDEVTTRLAVDMKVLIEQMREQVQNIE